MRLKLSRCKVYDPVQKKNGVIEDIYIENGRIIAPPVDDSAVQQCYDMQEKVVMAGAIDIHSHIGGGKINIARLLLPEQQPHDSIPTTFETGYRYIEMGYTAAFEPAILPINARHAHFEMQDIPMIDTGGYVVLGNDDFFLRLLARNAPQQQINDYVAWVLCATGAMGVKIVNAGGISAFKFNQRQLDIDEKNPHYAVTPRQILHSLATAVYELGLTHPLHVHGSNLGVAGNIETTLSTIAGMQGLPIHLTHIQFHSYDNAGDRGFSSGASRLVEALQKYPEISIDVGQIMFGQTVTTSADTMAQHRHHHHAHPKKWLGMDIECESGCGVVPFRYRDKNFVHALQWIIGLETFLLMDDLWRVCLTTDHPNGAPFTSYPHLIRLLMDRRFRAEQLQRLPADAIAYSQLIDLQREYSLYEIAIVTRAGAAKLLGLHDRGHLAVGAMADITVYSEQEDKEQMFASPDYVFKSGELVVKQGKCINTVQGGLHLIRPEYDIQIEKSLKQYFERYHTVNFTNYPLSLDELQQQNQGEVFIHSTPRRSL